MEGVPTQGSVGFPGEQGAEAGETESGPHVTSWGVF